MFDEVPSHPVYVFVAIGATSLCLIPNSDVGNDIAAEPSNEFVLFPTEILTAVFNLSAVPALPLIVVIFGNVNVLVPFEVT